MNRDYRPVVQAGLGEATRAGAAERLRRTGLPVLFALSILLPLHASAADLLSLFRLAEERDPVLKGAQAGLRATLEAFPQARASLLPSVGITANVARNFQQVTVPERTTLEGIDDFGGGDFTFTNGGYSLNVTQLLYHRDRFIRLKQADSRIRQAQHEADAAYQEL